MLFEMHTKINAQIFIYFFQCAAPYTWVKGKKKKTNSNKPVCIINEH